MKEFLEIIAPSLPGIIGTVITAIFAFLVPKLLKLLNLLFDRVEQKMNIDISVHNRNLIYTKARELASDLEEYCIQQAKANLPVPTNKQERVLFGLKRFAVDNDIIMEDGAMEGILHTVLPDVRAKAGTAKNLP